MNTASASTTVCPQEYWDGLYQPSDLRYEPEKVVFADAFRRYFKPGSTCFEIGCYPGTFLSYIGKELKCQVSGVDATPKTPDLVPFLESLGAAIGHIDVGDIFTYQPRQLYDVVCSFGFIEHFHDTSAIIRKHLELARPGGLVFISCPNFRWTQRVLHAAFDKENLDRHILPTMDFSLWRRHFTENGAEVLEARYHLLFNFWMASSQLASWKRPAYRLTQWVSAKCGTRNWLPNRFTSPYMYMVARKAK